MARDLSCKSGIQLVRSVFGPSQQVHNFSCAAMYQKGFFYSSPSLNYEQSPTQFLTPFCSYSFVCMHKIYPCPTRNRSYVMLTPLFLLTIMILLLLDQQSQIGSKKLLIYLFSVLLHPILQIYWLCIEIMYFLFSFCYNPMHHLNILEDDNHL